MDKFKVINDFIIANELALKRLCFKFFKLDDRRNDLFQEAYISMIDLPEKTISLYNGKLGTLYWLIARGLYYKQRRKSSPLRLISGIEVGENLLNESPEYTIDIEEFIETEMNKEHDFIPITVFMECQEKSMRQLSKETKINMFALSRYRAEGQARLKKLLQ